jgi:hypothetical protein
MRGATIEMKISRAALERELKAAGTAERAAGAARYFKTGRASTVTAMSFWA